MIKSRKNALKQLDVMPGDKLDVDPLKGQLLQLRPRKGTSVSTIFGLLKRPSNQRLTIEEINEITAAAWAGER